MPDFRQNPLTGQWVIIAPDRAKRPGQPKRDGTSRPGSSRVASCQFCAGNEQRTPSEVYAVRDDYGTTDHEGWRVRVVPNKYPALAIDAEGVPTPESIAFNTFKPRAKHGDESLLRVTKPGIGMHEVVIESPAHDRHFHQHDAAQREQIIRALLHRARMIMQARDVKLVTVFKNHGPSAGATIEHPHFQIIAPAVLPPLVKAMIDRQESYAKETGGAMLDTLVEEELAAGQRIIASDKIFVTLAPWAAAWPYEIWIIPRLREPHFSQMLDAHAASFAAALGDALLRLHKVLNDPDYNLVIHSGPKGHQAEEHHGWFAQIAPRLTTPAGFETGTGMFINTVTPEESAAALRDVDIAVR